MGQTYPPLTTQDIPYHLSLVFILFWLESVTGYLDIDKDPICDAKPHKV